MAPKATTEPSRSSRRRKEPPVTNSAAKTPKRAKTEAKDTPEPSRNNRRRNEPPVASSGVKSSKRDKKQVTAPSIVLQRKSEAGIVLTVGQGEVGQLGLGPDVTSKMRFGTIPSLENVVDICAGGMHTVCLTADGSVHTFGCDDEGALGRQATEDDSFLPGKVPLDGLVAHISAGDSHTAALLTDGRVFVWGSFRDSHGSMGLLSKEILKTPTPVKLEDTVVKLSSGADHLVLLTDKGQLFSCGCPEQGQLGRVTARSAKRDSRAGLTTFLVPKLVKFRVNLIFNRIWATTYGTFAMENSGRVYVCGLNNYHQLGLEATEPVYQPMISKPLSDSGNKWKKVEGGEHHTILLDEEGKVYTLGRKEYGRLGLGKEAEDALQPTLVPALTDIKCVDVACGSAVSFAVTEKGECYGWGMGSNGQLGAGDDESDVFDPQLLVGKQLQGKKIFLVAAGGQHTVLLARPE